MTNLNLLELGSIGLTGLVFFSTIVCGLWLRYSGEVIEEGAILFHMSMGFLTVILTSITFFLLINR